MPQFDFQLLNPGFQLTDGIPKSFDRVICDGSHCRLDGHREGLTKAEESPASWRTVYRQVCRHCAGSEGPMLVDREEPKGPSAPLVRSLCLVIKISLAPTRAKLRIPRVPTGVLSPCCSTHILNGPTALSPSGRYAHDLPEHLGTVVSRYPCTAAKHSAISNTSNRTKNIVEWVSMISRLQGQGHSSTLGSYYVLGVAFFLVEDCSLP